MSGILEEADMRERFFKDPLAVFSGIFIIIVLGVFPLYFRDYYFDIVDVKYRLYWGSSLVYIGCCLIILLWTGLKNRKKADVLGYRGRLSEFLRNWKASFPVWMLLLFWVNCVISTLQSDYLYESFWGNEGRYTGLFLITLYVGTTLLVTLFTRIEKWYVDISVVVTGIVGGLGICDYLEIDVLGFQKASELVPNKNEFMSTIGNVNFYTAFLSVGVAAAVVLFVVEDDIRRRVFYLIFSGVGYASMILGQSDSIYITIGCMFFLLPLFCLRNIRCIERILVQMSLFISVLGGIVWLNTHYKKVIETRNLFDVLGEYSRYINALIICLWGITILAFWLRRKCERKKGFCEETVMKKWRRALRIVLALVFLGILFVILDANFGGNPEKYGDFKFYLVFADKWGSSRGMVWRIGIQSWLKQPFMHKMFGFGPETFGILTWEYRVETATASHSIFDSMHNEYLQNLVTMGPIGMLSYIALLVSTIIVTVKRGERAPWLYAIAIAVACYGAQAMVNISMPIVAPVLWIYLGLGLAAVRRIEHGEEKHSSEENE